MQFPLNHHPNDGKIRAGDAVRAAQPQPCLSETGLVVEVESRSLTVRWTSGETTTVAKGDVRLIER